MNGSTAVIGFSLLCALAFSAITASGAMAETKTTTAFTCVDKNEPKGAGFSKEHCNAADAVSSGAKFEHVDIAPNTWTAFDATDEKTASETGAPTNAVLSGTVGGLKATFTAKRVTATGEVENFTATPGSGSMDIKQRNVILHFTEVTLTGALATIEGCKVKKSEVTSKELEATSLVNTMEAEYKPEAGTTLAVIDLEGCKTEELNKNGVVVSGTVRAIGDGATVETTVASTSGLKAAGQTASLTSKLTPRMTNGVTTENPIGATTSFDSEGVETKTTTASTCAAAEGGKGFSKEHCNAANAVETGANFKPVEIPPNEWTAFDETNEKTDSTTTGSTNAVLSGTVGGLKATFTAKKVTATGELENFTATPGSGSMDIKQRHVILHFTEVILSGALATTEECKVKGAALTSTELESTSLVNTMEAEYKPEVGTTFWVLELEGCKTKELNEKGVLFTGTFKAIGDGATVETTFASTGGLKGAGQAASLTSKLTPRMTNGNTTESPISAETIIDP